MIAAFSNSKWTQKLRNENELSVTSPTTDGTPIQATYLRPETQYERVISGRPGTDTSNETNIWSPSSIEGSGTGEILHNGIKKSSDHGSGFNSFTSPNQIGVHSSLDSPVIQHTRTGLRSSPNHNSVHLSQSLPSGRVDGTSISLTDCQWSSGTQHEPLGPDGPSNQIPVNPNGTHIRVPILNQTGSIRPSLNTIPLPPPPPPPPPPPHSKISSNRTTTTKTVTSNTITEYPKKYNSRSKTADFDVDEIFKDVKFDTPQQVNIIRRQLPPVQISTTQLYTNNNNLSPGTGSGEPPYTSPSAIGLAPAPTDQPIRNPVRYGVEGEVDALTIRMVNNMLTGEGAAGEHNCAKCGEGLSLMRPGCTALNQTYHLDCFLCGHCRKRLVGGSFYSVDDKSLCEDCYETTLERCTVCQRNIKDRILKANGKPYHPSCFLCASCGRCLDAVPFTVDATNGTHCVQCFHEKFAPRCAQCRRPIVPEDGKEETLRVVAMDRSYHVDCYRCEDCGMKLSSKVEGHECYPLDGHLLCKHCNGKRLRVLTEAKVAYT